MSSAPKAARRQTSSSSRGSWHSTSPLPPKSNQDAGDGSDPPTSSDTTSSFATRRVSSCRCADPGRTLPVGGRASERFELQSLDRQDLEVLRTRFDRMSDEELATYMEAYVEKEEAPRRSDEEGGYIAGTADETEVGRAGVNVINEQRDVPPTSSRADRSTSTSSSERGHSTPLFPPSPPPYASVLVPGRSGLGRGDSATGTAARKGDHPLRILARAVLELQETVARLQQENAVLRAEIDGAVASEQSRSRSEARLPITVSMHEDLSEAISTSLTSPGLLPLPLPKTTGYQSPPASSRLPDPPLIPSPPPGPPLSRARSPRPHNPYDSQHTGMHPSSRSVRSIDARSDPLHQSSSRSVRSMEPRADLVLASNRSARSVDMAPTNGIEAKASAGRSTGPVQKKRDARSSWTASLWGWGGSPSGGAGRTKPGRERKGSTASSLRSAVVQEGQVGLDEPVVLDDEDEHAWRRGDGGSPPAFKAVFLATRLLTPDPSSILASPLIAPDSLVARLAHSLVSTARDQGISARDPPGRRRSSRETRSRATSLYSHELPDAKDGDDLSSGKAGRVGGSGGDGGKQAEWGYGETLIAAGSYGRNLLSTVSGGTLRPAKSKGAGASNASSVYDGGGTVRPSLLSRGSARTYPTTALSQNTAADISPDARDPSAETNGTGGGLSLAPVEMAAIVADEEQPPTVLLSRQNLASFFQSNKAGRVQTASRFNKGSEPPLTDRYGFIYDIQHASMLKDASEAGAPAPASLNGLIAGHHQLVEAEGQGWIERHRRASQDTRPEASRRSTGSIEMLLSGSASPARDGSATATIPRGQADVVTSAEAAVAGPKDGAIVGSSASSANHAPGSADYRHRSSTLLSLVPSPARPVIAKDTLTVSARGASSLRSAASSPLFTPATEIPSALYPDSPPLPLEPNAGVSRATISSLLDQLTELHDRQQAERKAEWDTWLRKRKRHAAKASAEGKGVSGWGTDLIGISQMGLGKNAEEWRGFAKLVRRGIPLEYRADVWAECSGAKDALVPGEYKEILDVHSGDQSPVLRDIEKDVSRTFPGNMFFGGDGPGVAKLRRVLVAYSWRNPNVGYCQGMNMLTATLLLTHTDEEQAFWVLAAMLDRLLPADFYSPSLLASRADQAVLSDLVDVHLQKISSHLADLGVDLASITFGWFLSLFTDCLPVETLFRVWDVFFVEGHDTLFRVALAILKLNESEICGTESAADLFVFVAGMTSRLWAADKLITTQHSFKSVIRHSDIAGRFSRHVAALQDA